MADTQIRNAGPNTPDTYMVSADQDTIVGNGTTSDPLRASSAATEGRLIGRQVFNTAGSGTYVPTPGTRRAVVSGCGGGGGGGGCGASVGTAGGGMSGGNSGISVQKEFAAAGPLLVGGAYTVGDGGAGGVAGFGDNGEDSTITIEGTTLTAPGGQGGVGATAGDPDPKIIGPFQQIQQATGVDFQSCDLGGVGFSLGGSSFTNANTIGGAGGSGSFGIGGRGAGGVLISTGAGGNATGNGAGGGGAAVGDNDPASDGGDGAPGIWIIEEYS